VAAGRIPVSVIVIRESGTRRRFDAATDSWTVTTPDGRCEIAQSVIDARRSDDPTLAVHGLPNFFRVPGPDVERQARYVQRCLDYFERSGATRIEAKSRITLRRWRPATVRDRFYLTSLPTGDDEDLYDGPAVLGIDDQDIDVQVRLSGNLAAIDGRYHWRGTVTGDLPDGILKGKRAVTLSVTSAPVQARVVERTPWGGYTVTGDGAPPFAVV
jgi:hypothetical protein